MKDPRELTAEQEKAWKSLKRAVKKCKEADIYFYQVLDYTYALNGNIVSDVESCDFGCTPDGAWDLFQDGAPWNSVTTACSFADDPHYAILK